MAKKTGFGQGLDSLLPRVTAMAEGLRSSGLKPRTRCRNERRTRVRLGKPMEIPVGEIDRNPYQTRTHFDEKLLAELAESDCGDQWGGAA